MAEIGASMHSASADACDLPPVQRIEHENRGAELADGLRRMVWRVIPSCTRQCLWRSHCGPVERLLARVLSCRSGDELDESALTSLLVREVSDLLDAGDVGLYEFVWILNSLKRRPDAELAQRCIRRALNRLLTDPGVKLVMLRWADPTLVEVLKVHELPAGAWAEPGDDGLHVGVKRLIDLPVGDGRPSEACVLAEHASRSQRCRPWADLWPGPPT